MLRMEALRVLHERLRNEHLFVRNEKETIRRLHADAQQLAEKLQHAVRISGDQQRILDAMESWGGVLTPADCARKIRDLELTRFVDARSKLGEDGERAMGDLLNYVISRPSVLAELLFVCERESVDVKGISSVVVYALYARSVTPDDEKTMAEVLHHVMFLQVKSCQNLRRFFRGNAQAFSHLFRTWCEGLLSAKPYLKASLQPAVMEVVRDADESGCLEYDAIRAIQQLSQDDRSLWYGGNEHEKSSIFEKIQTKLGVASSRLASFCIIILQSLHEQINTFPSSVRWLVSQFKAALIGSQVVTERSIACLLTDMVFGCFICPVLVDPQKHGIASELVITKEAKHNLTRVSQILRDLALIDLQLRDEHLAKVHASMELGNWRSFLDDLTTGVGDPVAPPLMSSFGFQKTAVLATDRELKIFVNIFCRCINSFTMRGQLAADSQMIERILSNVPSAYKPSSRRLPPTCTDATQYKSLPFQSVVSTLLPSTPGDRNSMPARQSAPQLLEVEGHKHQRSLSSDVGDFRMSRASTVSEPRLGRGIGVEIAGGRRHTYSATMLQRKQSVMAAADVLVVPLKTDCYTGQNATRLQLMSEQQVLRGRTESSVSSASTVNSRSSGSHSEGVKKGAPTLTSDEMRRSASVSDLPKSYGSGHALVNGVHTTAGDTALGKDNPFINIMNPSTTVRPSSLPMDLNMDMESHSRHFEAESLLAGNTAQLESRESSREALKSPESEPEEATRDPLQVNQEITNGVQDQEAGGPDTLNTPLSSIELPDILISPDHVDVHVADIPVKFSPKSGRSAQAQKIDTAAANVLGDFDPIHSDQINSTLEASNAAQSSVEVTNQQPPLQRIAHPSGQLDSDSGIHSLLSASGDGSLVSTSDSVGTNTTENAVTEVMPGVHGQERSRQGLLKKVSGSKIGRMFRRKQNTESDSAPASASASLTTSPAVSPRSSPRPSPSSSPGMLRKQKGKKLAARAEDANSNSSVASSTKSSSEDLIVLSPCQDVIKEEEEDITLKYERKMQEWRRQQEELNSPVDPNVEEESCSELGDDDDPLVAFCDAKKQLRTLLSSFDVWPLVGQKRSSYSESSSGTEKPAELLEILRDARDLENSRSHSKYYSVDVRWLLQLWLAEASENDEQVQVAALKEALRALDLLPSDKRVEVIDSLEHEYYQRSSYISYLTRTKQSLLRVIAMMERKLKRIKKYKKICWSNFTTVRVKALFECHEQALTSFAMQFEATKLTDEKSDLLDEFFQDVQSFMESDEAFSGISDEQKEFCMNVAERLCFSTVYTEAFYPNGEADIQKDRIMYDLIQQLSKKVTLSHVPAAYRKCAPWQDAQDALFDVGAHRSPRDKVQCVRQCASSIMNTLHVSCAPRVPAADDFFPVMVYVIIKANPPHLPSTIQYIHTFQEKHMHGESSYWWTQFCMAVEYIKTMKSPS